jgi:hypothetical protein
MFSWDFYVFRDKIVDFRVNFHAIKKGLFFNSYDGHKKMTIEHVKFIPLTITFIKKIIENTKDDNAMLEIIKKRKGIVSSKHYFLIKKWKHGDSNLPCYIKSGKTIWHISSCTDISMVSSFKYYRLDWNIDMKLKQPADNQFKKGKIVYQGDKDIFDFSVLSCDLPIWKCFRIAVIRGKIREFFECLKRRNAKQMFRLLAIK